ncbi:MAG TPA: chorismate synthase [Candidatus Limnocylindrales bacterium]|nr:chorismate synthase [Candidatus Limnocylindrales bacterium]
MRYLSGGESHGPCLTGIVEGLPAGLALHTAEINRHLQRRQSGFGRGARMAIEKDRVEILSGLRFNRTLGSPLTLQVKNRDWENWQEIMAPEGQRPPEATPLTRPRPGHADLAGGLKYNHDDLRAVLERSSARETAMRVAVGSVARLLLEKYEICFYSHVLSIGSISVDTKFAENVSVYAEQIEKSPVRCAEPRAEEAMMKEIEAARRDGDTLGGVFELVITGVPPGLGSYVHWDRRLDGRLAGALISIQGIKGVEIGSGFFGATLRGSVLHDPIIGESERGIIRPSNRAGGLEGGTTNGQSLILRAAMKPIPTLASPLPSVDWSTGLNVSGAVERSDVCAVPSAAVVAEAVLAWELAVAFREKFGGDFIEEVDAAYSYYREHVCRCLRQKKD